MAITFDATHDPATGEWFIVAHDPYLGIAPACGLRWSTTGRPDCDAWWQSVRAADPELAERLRGDEVRREFESLVARIQSECSCDDCTQAAGARDDAGRAALARAARKARTAEQATLTYAEARRRYMETGTIADKEAMLACVTETVPDLGTLGRDWEPAAPRITAGDPQRGHARHRAAAEVISLAGCLVILITPVLGLPPELTAIASVCLIANLALYWRSKRRE